MLLSDKICIITGAASPRGIGRATARLFAAQGARVVILDLAKAKPVRPPPTSAKAISASPATSPTSKPA